VTDWELLGRKTVRCHYLLFSLASGEGIVSLSVTLCVRISLGGEGNALYPVLSTVIVVVIVLLLLLLIIIIIIITMLFH